MANGAQDRRPSEHGPERHTPQRAPTEQAAVPLAIPTQSRKAILVKSELLKVRMEDRRMQGGNEDELQDLRQEVEQADRVAKQAGGASESKLRLETMDQARKNARKRAAIQRASSALEAACQKRDQAVAEVEAAEERLGVLEAELEQGRARHAYLAAQQAAETRPSSEVQAVQSALAALRMAGGALPPELRQQLGILDQAISMFYPRGNEVEEALAQAGLGETPTPNSPPWARAATRTTSQKCRPNYYGNIGTRGSLRRQFGGSVKPTSLPPSPAVKRPSVTSPPDMRSGPNKQQTGAGLRQRGSKQHARPRDAHPTWR